MHVSVHTHTHSCNIIPVMKFKNSHIGTILLRDTCKGGKNIKKSKDSIITKVTRIITSEGEEQGCDQEGAHSELLESGLCSAFLIGMVISCMFIL